MLALAALWGLSGPPCAAPARADAPPGGVSAQTLPQWWGAPGRPGYVPDAALAGGMPWTLAGLTAGAWQLRDPLAPATLPAPGVAEAQAPMAWYDSSAVVVGEDAAWSGYGAALATASGFERTPAGRKPRAMFTVTSGTSGVDRTSIFITRGTTSGWLRAGATGDERGGVGDLGHAGDHLWSVSAGTLRGRNTFEGGFAQRGMDEQQLTGVGDRARGQSGQAGWSRRIGRDSVSVRVARGYDDRELDAIGTNATEVHREEQENVAEAQYWRPFAGGQLGLRGSWREGHVLREMLAPGSGLPPLQMWGTSWGWWAARLQRPLAGGRLDLQLGSGRDRAAGASPLAPGASWSLASGSRSLRLFGERALVPVWSDLQLDTAPFLQDTWLGGFEAAAGPDSSSRASLSLLAGRTLSRATALRYPVRAEGLLIGWARDPGPYRFVLAQAGAATHWRALGADASAYALARPSGTSQPRVDPGLGARAGLQCRFRAFAGDLGVRLRVEGAYVGARESDPRVTDELGNPVEVKMLPGFETLSLSAAFTLGDATILVRGDNVGGTRQSESWVDPNQYPALVLARDAGPVWRTEVTWPLFN